MMDKFEIIRVPTIMHKPRPREVDISQMNETELQLLKTQDPFLYHSIPQIKKAKLGVHPIDHTKVLQDVATQSSSDHIISRQTRVSTECHASLAIEGFIDEILLDDMLFFSPPPPSKRSKNQKNTKNYRAA